LKEKGEGKTATASVLTIFRGKKENRVKPSNQQWASRPKKKDHGYKIAKSSASKERRIVEKFTYWEHCLEKRPSGRKVQGLWGISWKKDKEK